MKIRKLSVPLTEYEIEVLKENDMISTLCKKQLQSAKKLDDEEVELSMTLAELTDLIGYVAAEANHARGKRKREDLNEICDYLEALEFEARKNSK